ncbi:MAG: helix-turn-helix transcriptional regulator [Bacteroidetes bacterium]|nr:helix-turn-helix transcriptional regulator [Bacteroidota bacterium]
MRNYLGEFEELVLLSVGILGENAYGVTVKDEMEARTGKIPSIGALHSALNRLEKKGYIRSHEGGATSDRGGRRKRFFLLTASGKKALVEARDLRDTFWDALPSNFAWE